MSPRITGDTEDMRDSFRLLDGTIASVNNEMEDGDSLDSIRVKAIITYEER